MSEKSSLVIFERAAQMLAEADTIQKARELKNLALTAADWAKRKGMGEAAIQHCRSYALEAERKMGEMLAQTERAKGAKGNPRGRGARIVRSHDVTAQPTLASLGLTKRESARAQKLATIPKDEFRNVSAGKISVEGAFRDLRKRTLSKTIAALPDGKYRVIYADPPWQYNDTREGIEGMELSAAEGQYPTMSVLQLSALDVKQLAADDCVLFCWATFPLLIDALEVVRSWGFKYKTSFVWAKVRPNFGHYHNANAELLLLCTRGSATPDADKRESQVQTIERTGKHSAKPECFREMIDRMYVAGKRIELFRRGDCPPGWEVWGNETT